MSAELARAGDFDALLEKAGTTGGGPRDRQVYMWLCAAEDFGHDASESISDLLEWSSLRYDDDGYEQAAAHWELACAYLLGEDGLEVDLEHASKHLLIAFEAYDLDEIAAGTATSFDAHAIAERLDPAARKVLERGMTRDPYRDLVRRIERLRRLREIGSVPKVILQNEARLLMEEARTLAGDDLPEDES